MAYKALRVPICLLQQKAYENPRRLPKLKILKVDKPIPPAKTVVFHQVTNGLDSRHPFDRLPYLRKYFYKGPGNVLRCRACDEVMCTDEERMAHTGCTYEVNMIILKLLETSTCALCEAPIRDSPILLQSKYAGVPICSEDCMYVWNEYVPPSFEFELNLNKLKKSGEQHAL